MGADQLRLAEIITKLEPFCAGFHVDMMDGHLVPNITGGPTWINAISQFTQKPVWAHLMVTDPAEWIPRLQLPTTSMIDFQWEAKVYHQDILTMIRKKGFKAGLSIAPKTPIQSVIPLIEQCDYISVMGVNPGFSGQSYLPETTKKIAELNAYKIKNNFSFFIACDGGITKSLIPHLKTAGVTHAAVASALFTEPDPITFLKKYNH